MFGTEQIEARAKFLGVFGQDGTNPTPDSVAHHRIADRFPDCVPHMGVIRVIVGEWGPAQPAPAAAATSASVRQRIERRASAQCPNQAESFLRPWRRRPATILRPALVDMRWRKPWRLARRRTFGW